jgi:hypothetical protein
MMSATCTATGSATKIVFTANRAVVLGVVTQFDGETTVLICA